MSMGQTVLNPTNRDYFNKLILKSADKFADSLPHDITINLVDESEREDYIPVEINVPPDVRRDFVRLYMDEFDTFGDDLLGQPLNKVFSGLLSEKQEQELSRQPDFNKDCARICERIWEVAYTLIMEQKYAQAYRAAQLRFTDHLYDRAYETYYEKRDARGYTQADYKNLGEEPEQDYEM